jgi:hypothetical protein
MFGKVFRKTELPEEEKRRITIFMSSKKPVTLLYRTDEGEKILLAKETTAFKGEISISDDIQSFQCIFEGENIRRRKNAVRVEIAY